MGSDELSGAGSSVDEDLTFRVGGDELRVGSGGRDGDGEEEVGVAADVVEDSRDDVGRVAEEHDGEAVDAGDAELVGGDAADDGNVFGSSLVPVVVQAARGESGKRGQKGARRGGDHGDWGCGPQRSGGEGAGLDRAGVGDGVIDAGVVDAVECLEALVRVGGERVVAVGGAVLDADFGGSERVEARRHLGAGGLGESCCGDEGADTEDGAERGEQGSHGALRDDRERFGEGIASTEHGRRCDVGVMPSSHVRRGLR